METLVYNDTTFIDVLSLVNRVSPLLEMDFNIYGLTNKDFKDKDVKLYASHFFLKEMFNKILESNSIKICMYINTECLPTLYGKYDSADFIEFYSNFILILKKSLNLRTIIYPKSLLDFINEININSNVYEAYLSGIEKTCGNSKKIYNFFSSMGLKQLHHMYSTIPKLKMVMHT